jgi:hypothetical protein
MGQYITVERRQVMNSLRRFQTTYISIRDKNLSSLKLGRNHKKKKDEKERTEKKVPIF